MSIQRVRTKDGYAYKVRVRVVDAVTGAVRHPSRTFRFKKDAEKAEREWQTEVDRGTAIDPNTITVAAYMRSWVVGKANRVKPSSAAGYRAVVESYVIPKLGATPLQKLTALQIQQFEQALLTTGRRRTSGGLSKTYVHAIHVALKSALKEAVKLGLIGRNVADNVTPPPIENPPKVTWDQAQAQAFLRIAETDGYWPAWLLALATGMRRGELIGLCWQDVDLKTGTLTVRANITAPNGKITDGSTKSGKARSIQVDKRITDILKAQQLKQRERHMRIGAPWSEQTTVLTSAVGTVVHPFNFSQRFRDLIEVHDELPKIRLHDLRHSAATLLLAKGVHPKVVSEMLGHANIGITLAIYGHLLPGMQEQAARIMGNLLFDPTVDTGTETGTANAPNPSI